MDRARIAKLTAIHSQSESAYFSGFCECLHCSCVASTAHVCLTKTFPAMSKMRDLKSECEETSVEKCLSNDHSAKHTKLSLKLVPKHPSTQENFQNQTTK